VFLKRNLAHQKNTLAKDQEYETYRSSVAMNLVLLSSTSSVSLEINEDSLAMGEGLGITYILTILDNS